jgi:hypothetical protein
MFLAGKPKSGAIYWLSWGICDLGHCGTAKLPTIMEMYNTTSTMAPTEQICTDGAVVRTIEVPDVGCGSCLGGWSSQINK